MGPVRGDGDGADGGTEQPAGHRVEPVGAVAQAVPPGGWGGVEVVAVAGERRQAVGTVRGAVRVAAVALPAGVAGSRVQVQEQAVLAGRDGDRLVPVDVSVGEAPACERGAEGSRGDGSRGSSADVRDRGGEPDSGHRGGADAASAEAEHRRGGSGVSGLRVDQLVDSARGLPGDAAQEGDRAPGRGEARSQSAAGRHVRPDHRVHERADASDARAGCVGSAAATWRPGSTVYS